MFLVSRSTTGQYVLSHPASQTVIVGDDLEASFERMRELATEHVAAPNESPPGTVSTPTPGAPTRWLPWLALALLPFIWLGALHVSLGRLVSELRVATAPASASAAEHAELRARVERLERRLEERTPMGARPQGGVAGPRAPAAATPDDDRDDDDGRGDDADAKDTKPSAPEAKAETKLEAKAETELDAKPEPRSPAKAGPLDDDD